MEQISSRSMGREAPVRWQQMSCQKHWHDPWQQLLSLLLTSRDLKHWSCCSRSDNQCHSSGSHILQESKEQDSAPSLIYAPMFTSAFSIGFGRDFSVKCSLLPYSSSRHMQKPNSFEPGSHVFKGNCTPEVREIQNEPWPTTYTKSVLLLKP